MTAKTLLELEKIKPQKIGKAPVVILPLKLWQFIEDQLEELEIAKAGLLRRKIDKARKEKTMHSSREVRKMLAA